MKLSSFSWVYGFYRVIIYMNSETHREKPTGNSHGSPKPNKITLRRSVEVVFCTAAQTKVLNIYGAFDMPQLLHPLSLSLPLASSSNCFLLQTDPWSSLACTKLDLFFPKQCNNLVSWGKAAWVVLCSGKKLNFSLKTCFSALMCASSTAGCLFLRSLLPVVFPSKPASICPVLGFWLPYLWVQVVWKVRVKGKCENMVNRPQLVIKFF